MWSRRTVVALAAISLLTCCAPALNYPSATGPRYASAVAPVMVPSDSPSPTPKVIRLVTFNIQLARRIDSAIVLLESAEPLAHADVITLQEMDAAGTERIASALGMFYVYYPATVFPSTKRDFGDAILSRWPIIDDQKIILPHLSRFGRTERIATAATIRIGARSLRVYSVHLGTWAEEGGSARRDQVRVILADAEKYPQVIVAGDMNNHSIGRVFRAAGYAWPTEHNPRTDHFWNWDHMFLRGLSLYDSASTGVVRDNRHASDHRPVWALVALADRGPESTLGR